MEAYLLCNSYDSFVPLFIKLHTLLHMTVTSPATVSETTEEALTWQDLMRIDSERARDIRVTIVEGMQLLGSFDVRLREYAADKLHKQGVQLVKVCPCLSWPLLMQPRMCRMYGQGNTRGKGQSFAYRQTETCVLCRAW